MAALFPKGLRKKSKVEFERDGHQGGALQDPGTLSPKLKRFGLRSLDFVVSVDGYVVENEQRPYSRRSAIGRRA